MKKLFLLTLFVLFASVSKSQTNRPFSLKDIQQSETYVMYQGKVVASFVNDSSLTVIDSLGTIKSLIKGITQHSEFAATLQQTLDAAKLVLSHISPTGVIEDKNSFIADYKRYKDLIDIK